MPASSAVRMRPATVDDVSDLERFDGEPHVAAVSGNDDHFDWGGEIPRHVPWREIRVAELDGTVIGVVVIIDAAEEETHYWGDEPPGTMAIDIWIGVPGLLRRGHGTAMMRDALARCFARPATRRVLIDPLAANGPAIAFYRAIGFRDLGPRRFGEDDCLVLEFPRETWEREAPRWFPVPERPAADA